MFDRADKISLALYVAVGLAIALLVIVVGSALSAPGLLPTILLDALLIFPFAYPAYWALNIRRSLASPLYRRQALGVSLMCLAYVIGANESTGVGYGFFLLLVFYWIDVSYRTARRSDPRLRDSLGWSRLRIVLWAINIGFYAIVTGIVLSGDYGFITSTSLGQTLDAVPFFLIAGSGVALGVVVSRRTTDSALKGQVLWFAVFVFAQFASIIFASVNSLNGAVYFYGFEFAGFSLYKSAKSLAPLNMISPIDSV